MKKLIVLFLSLTLFCSLSPAMAQESDVQEKVGGSKSLEKRIKELEDAIKRDVEGDKWYDRIQIGGLVEINAGYTTEDFEDPAEPDTDTTDLDLATVELAVDAKVVKHVDAHVLFKWEEDEIFVDEGFVTLTGSENFPAYLIAGRQYVPFGYYDSFFITDPNTLVLGETNQGAAVAGYRIRGEMIDITLGAFNGDIEESGDDDDHIDSFVAGIFTNPVEGLMIGVSYTSNLGSSDSFQEFVTGPVESLVGGWSAYATYDFLGRFKVIGEYLAALESFNAGEVYDPLDTKERQPAAWNIEFGAGLTDSLTLALRYGGSDDGGAEFLPETQYGAVLGWGFFDNTNLAFEYMRDEYKDDVDIKTVDTFTAQLAVEF